MNASNGYEITLNKIDLRYDTTLQYEEQGDAGQLVDISPYYQGRIIRLGISATGSTWEEALQNTIIAASGSSFNTSY
jgi:hypothetical protein